jgi:hypothetical protein
MSNSRIPKRGSKTDRIPAHYLDPIKKNPAPVGHPAHEIWEAATRQAEIELLDYQSEMLKIRTRTGPEFALWELKLALRTMQVWAKRGLCIVLNSQDARMYEKWLESYVQAWLMDARRYFAAKLTNPFLVESTVVEFRMQLMRAQRYWTSNAIRQVLANKANQVEAPEELTVATTESAPRLTDANAGLIPGVMERVERHPGWIAVHEDQPPQTESTAEESNTAAAETQKRKRGRPPRDKTTDEILKVAATMTDPQPVDLARKICPNYDSLDETAKKQLRNACQHALDKRIESNG